MPRRSYAMVASPRDKAGLSSTSSSDHVHDGFWVRYFFGTIVRLVRLCSAGLVVCAVLYFLAPYNRIAETTTHFVTWYATFGLAGTVVALITRQWKLTILCLLFTLFYCALIAPWYLIRPMQPAGSNPNLRVVTANLLSINDHTDLFSDWVKETDPDIIFVQELSPHWSQALAELKKVYPHQREQTRSDHFGIGLYSKLPLQNVEIVKLAGERLPAIRADVQVHGRTVSMLNMHTVPPLTAAAYALRNAQLQAAGEFANDADDLAIVAGDLNITIWSPYYRKLEADSGLRNVRRGYGIIPSWPANLPFFRIALDHILVPPDILVVDLERGPDVGSDHLPLVADLFVSAKGTPGY